MENITNPSTKALTKQPVDRRRFLRYAGFSVAMTTALITACENPGADPATNLNAGARVSAPGDVVDLGSGDVGVLNYAYALEQLEYAFYQRVITTPYAGISSEELFLLREVRDHEFIHREFLRVALGSAGIPMLGANFSSIDFTKRQDVLNAAKDFEDLGVTAYNGAGRLISDPGNLVLAGKIVSVEARHAALIRHLLLPRLGFFAGDNIVDPNTGLDPANPPSFVLGMAQKFIVETITANNLPKM